MLLHHAARGSAGAAGLDDTGEVVAGDGRHRRLGGAHIGVGAHATCAVTADGTAYCWGWNSVGAVGIPVVAH